MAKSKKTTEQPERTAQPITEEPQMQVTAETPAQVERKPLFVDEKADAYRNLLLERPGVPVVTNIQEAITFVEAYQKWNSKVQIAFR